MPNSIVMGNKQNAKRIDFKKFSLNSPHERSFGENHTKFVHFLKFATFAQVKGQTAFPHTDITFGHTNDVSALNELT